MILVDSCVLRVLWDLSTKNFQNSKVAAQKIPEIEQNL